MGRLNRYSYDELYIAEVTTVNKTLFTLMHKTAFKDKYVALVIKTKYGYQEIGNSILCQTNEDADSEKYMVTAVKPLSCYMLLVCGEKHIPRTWYKMIKPYIELFMQSNKFKLTIKTSRKLSEFQKNVIERIVINGRYVEWKTNTQILMDVLRGSDNKGAELVFNPPTSSATIKIY